MRYSLICVAVTRARLPHSRPTLGAEGPDARGNRLGRMRPWWMQLGKERIGGRLVVSVNERTLMLHCPLRARTRREVEVASFIPVDCNARMSADL
jgi:hypothetical protein